MALALLVVSVSGQTTTLLRVRAFNHSCNDPGTDGMIDVPRLTD